MMQGRLHLARPRLTMQTVESGTERGERSANVCQLTGHLPGDLGIASEDTRRHFVAPSMGTHTVTTPDA